MSCFSVVYWMNKADITTKKRHVRFDLTHTRTRRRR
jgi:hypothetical protein